MAFVNFLSDQGSTEILAMKKRDKNSMKFSITNSEGLSKNLGGIVGQNLMPHEYHFDEFGNIQLKNRIIENTMVHFSEKDDCFKLRQVFRLMLARCTFNNSYNQSANRCIILKTILSESAVTTYLGHKRRDFILKSPFDSLLPSKFYLLENTDPK